MNVVAQIAVVLAGLVHVLIFAMESLLFTRAQVYRRFRTRAEDVATVRQWAFNQGWYNLFLAAGAIGGVIAIHAGMATAGRSCRESCRSSRCWRRSPSDPDSRVASRHTLRRCSSAVLAGPRKGARQREGCSRASSSDADGGDRRA